MSPISTWAKVLLLGPRAPSAELRASFVAPDLRFPELAATAQARGPVRETYAALAGLYHSYAHPMQPNYAAFLAELSRDRPVQSALDLACGVGTTTAELAAVIPGVVGLDLSEAMLAEARRRCQDRPGVRLVRGDFRAFDLGQIFDAAVCGANSLNYVGGQEDLAAVFRCVAAHLRPGGRFVFDTTTARGMRALTGRYAHYDVDGRRFAVHFQFDPVARREEATVLFPDGVEVHRRVPLDPPDVLAAAAGTGLRAEDYFSLPLIPGRWYAGGRCFYVLTRDEQS